MDFGAIKISTGNFDPKGLTTQNSLIANLLQYPEIAEDLYMMYPQYSLTYTTAPFIKGPEQQISDIKFRYSLIGRLERSMTCTGVVTSGISAKNPGYIEFEEDYAMPTSTWKFGTGNTQVIILGRPQRTTTGFKYQVKLVTGDITATFNTALAAQGKQAGPVANLHPEYSEKGWGSQQFPDWLENWCSTVRDERKVTGDAASSVTWLTKNGQSMWILGSPQATLNTFGDKDGGFLYKLEKQSWYGKTTVDSFGNVIMSDINGDLVPAGAGFIEQIPNSMSMDYSLSTLNEDTFLDVISQFKYNSGLQKGKIIVDTGAGGIRAFTKAMKQFAAIDARGIIYAMNTSSGNKNITIGQDFETYHALGCDIVVVENPILSDAVLNPELDPATGFPMESFNFYMRENSMEDGIPTVQKLVKGGNGLNRGMVIKVLTGMVDPTNPKSMTASNARDGYAYEFLSQFQLAVRKPNRVARLRRTA